MARVGRLALSSLVVASVFVASAAAHAQDLTERRRIEIAERLRESSVAVVTGDISGSGFVATREGWIVTNHHVAEAGQMGGLRVRFSDGRTFGVRILALDPSHDLAVLEVVGAAAPRARPLRLGDSDRVRIGQTVLAYGSPFGLEGTLTQGIVSARRDLPGVVGGAVRGLIQTDAPINPGNSGGPLVSARGEVIGVNTAILSRSGGSQGIGFAVPATYVRELLTRVRTEMSRRRVATAPGQRPVPAIVPGGVQLVPLPPPAPPVVSGAPGNRAWLGIYGDDFRQATYAGVRVTRVVPNSPAARAGILGQEDAAPP
ncbi:MAG: trypsin-like peptidase domain-containing protein, partial [Deltaproteobacteria bacterium]|nr:trypsin-like peptidase domain-containing protein [Deltaproteobacteria bacterium]